MVAIIDDLLIASAASLGVKEMFNGPVGNFLSTIFPSDNIPLRQLVNAYSIGSISLSELTNTITFKALEPATANVVLKYAQKMQQVKNDVMVAAANKATLAQLASINNDYDKLEADSFDIELDSFTNIANTAIANLQTQAKQYDTVFNAATKKGQQQPLIDALVAINEQIGAWKQLVLDKRTDIDTRKKALLDAKMKALPELVTEVISDKTAYKYAQEVEQQEMVSPDPKYVLMKYNYPISDRNILTMVNAIKSVESGGAAAITAPVITTPATAEVITPAPTPVPAPAPAPIPAPAPATTPAAFAGPYVLTLHYILNGADVYEVTNTTDNHVEYWSQATYDAAISKGTIQAPTGPAQPVITYLTIPSGASWQIEIDNLPVTVDQSAANNAIKALYTKTTGPSVGTTVTVSGRVITCYNITPGVPVSVAKWKGGEGTEQDYPAYVIYV